MGPGPRPPVGEQINQKNKVPLPKNFKEVPGYLKRLFVTFFFAIVLYFSSGVGNTALDLVCHGFHRHFQRCGPCTERLGQCTVA